MIDSCLTHCNIGRNCFPTLHISLYRFNALLLYIFCYFVLYCPWNISFLKQKNIFFGNCLSNIFSQRSFLFDCGIFYKNFYKFLITNIEKTCRGQNFKLCPSGVRLDNRKFFFCTLGPRTNYYERFYLFSN